MRWWVCCGILAVLVLITSSVFDIPRAVADMDGPAPVTRAAAAAPEIGTPEVPAPAEPSPDPPETVPVIDFCCARCDGRYNLCVANCGGDPACLQVCEDRFDACAAGCAGGC